MMTVQPLTLAAPSLYGVSGLGASSLPSISADGQLIAFASNADNLVPSGASGVANDGPTRPEYVAGSISARTALTRPTGRCSSRPCNRELLH